MPSVYECALLSEDVYEAQSTQLASGRGWSRTRSSPPNNNGFFGALYRKGSENIVAMRGTEVTSGGDLAADLEMGPGYNQIPEAQTTAAMSFMTTCLNNLSGRLNIVTGHSLGGALAKIVSQRRNRLAIAFNAPYIGGLQGATPMPSMLIHNYNSNLDPVSGLTRLIGSEEEGTTTSITVPPPLLEILGAIVLIATPFGAISGGAAAFHYHSITPLRQAIGRRSALHAAIEIPESLQDE